MTLGTQEDRGIAGGSALAQRRAGSARGAVVGSCYAQTSSTSSAAVMADDYGLDYGFMNDLQMSHPGFTEHVQPQGVSQSHMMYGGDPALEEMMFLAHPGPAKNQLHAAASTPGSPPETPPGSSPQAGLTPSPSYASLPSHATPAQLPAAYMAHHCTDMDKPLRLEEPGWMGAAAGLGYPLPKQPLDLRATCAGELDPRWLQHQQQQ